RRRGHEQLAVHDLVAVAVVGQRAYHVRRVVDRSDHTHSIDSQPNVGQEGDTPQHAASSPDSHDPIWCETDRKNGGGDGGGGLARSPLPGTRLRMPVSEPMQETLMSDLVLCDDF